MKARPRTLSLMLAVIVLAGNTAGCISPRTLSSDAVTYNLAVEEAQNRVLLLNVLRARHRRPMYLTAISEILGSPSRELSAGLALPFGGDAKSEFTASPGATYKDSLTLKLAVLDNQEFMQGFLDPIPAELFAYYIHMGWPKELLFHLLVLRIEVTKTEDTSKGEATRRLTLHNYPDAFDPGLCAWKSYAEFVRRLLQRDLRLSPHTGSTPVSPLLSELDHVASLVKADERGLVVLEEKPSAEPPRKQATEQGRPGREADVAAESEKEPTAYRLRRYTDVVRIEAKTRTGEAYDPLWLEPDSCGCLAVQEVDEPAEDPKDLPSTATRPEAQIEGELQEDGGVDSGKLTLSLHLRSPEAVLYYLGELTRTAARGRLPVVRVQNEIVPLFFARESDLDCKSGLVEVAFLGRKHIIPADEPTPEDSTASADAWASLPVSGAWPPLAQDADAACRNRSTTPVPEGKGEWGVVSWRAGSAPCAPGRSMHSLSLLSQLFALQKSAKDLPGTSLVQVVGQ